MDAGDQIALAAVVVAGAALIVSSILSVYSVWFSQRSAAAAEKSAQAAGNVVAVAKKNSEIMAEALRVSSDQLQLGVDERYRDEAPRYDLGELQFDGRRWLLSLAMASGHPCEVAVRVDVEYHTPFEFPFGGSTSEVIVSGSSFFLEWFPLDWVEGSSIDLTFRPLPNDVLYIEAKVTVRAKEEHVEEPRNWKAQLSRSWTKPR